MEAEDLRAAVAAGILTEAQAASVRALAEGRAGKRASMPAEDEPFEFFKGFSEIFISIGLVILMFGIGGLLVWISGATLLILVPAAVAGIAWWWATYFTIKRRMNLPSMVLALAFGWGVFLSVASALLMAEAGERSIAVLSCAVAALAMAGWYRRFRLPFSVFVLGLYALMALYSATATLDTLGGFISGARWNPQDLFDLGESPVFATATLLFGVACFLAGMWFDTRDPHRLGRHAATAFWLHLMAAPALVNTVALTLMNSSEGGLGIGLLAVALVIITALALVIDRRSFLSAAIGYIAIVLIWLLGDSEDWGAWMSILIVLGLLITAIGTWWVQLRAWLMRVLPDFPGKSRLPPYSMPE